MYTQRSVPPAEVNIPQNYAGNAFRYPPIGGLTPAESPPEEHRAMEQEETVLETTEEAREAYAEERGALRLPIRFGHHAGEEDLLLLGILFLLAGDGVIGREGEKSRPDLLLYLLLLFFCA